MKARPAFLFCVFFLSTGATVRDLGTLPGGAPSCANAVNEIGQAVGYSFDAAGVQRAVLFDGGSVIEIPTPVVPGSVTVAQDINDAGVVVGRMGTPLVHSRAFAWSPGSPVRDIGTGSSVSIAFGINNGKDVVGQWHDAGVRAVQWPAGWSTITDLGGFGGTLDIADTIADVPRIAGTSRHAGAGPRHAALWDDTTVIDLGTLGGDESFALAMVVRAWPDPWFTETFVAGDSQFTSSPDDTHAFLWNAGSMTDLGTLPGWHGSRAYGINHDLDIVGVAWEGTIEVGHRAVIWRGGVIEDLNAWISDPDWILEHANDVNNAGQIVGCGSYKGEGRAFLLEP